MPTYKPPAVDDGIAWAVGDRGVPELPSITFESSVSGASLYRAGVRQETTDFAPRANFGSIVQTEQNTRLTITQIISDPNEGYAEREYQAIDIGTGQLLPITEDAPLAPEAPAMAPEAPVAEIYAPPAPEPTATPTSEFIPYTQPLASEPGSLETTPLTVAQEAYLEEQLLASGCQSENVYDFGPNGELLGYAVNHFNGATWERVEYIPLY